MPDEDDQKADAEISTGDFRVDVAREIAKQLPVKEIYYDGLKSSVREAGSIVENILKTVHLALAPIQVAAIIQERFSRFIRGAAERVSKEDRVEPAPQVLGPVLEAIKYEPEGTPLDEMYSQLLSRAFDRKHSAEAHSAFVKIIGQMSAVEALMLNFIQQRKYLHEEDLREGTVSNGNYTENELWAETGIAGNRFAMVEHLAALRLLRVMEFPYAAALSRVQDLEELLEALTQASLQSPTRAYEISVFGDTFLKAVSSPLSAADA